MKFLSRVVFISVMGWSVVVHSSDSQMAYFGEHLIVNPGSSAAVAITKEFPAKLKRKTVAKALTPSLANMSIAVPMQSRQEAVRSPLCGKQSVDALTVCLDAGALRETEKLAALAFMTEPTVVLVASDAGMESFQHLLAGDAQRSAHTEIRLLDAAVCSGECASRIQLVRK